MEHLDTSFDVNNGKAPAGLSDNCILNPNGSTSFQQKATKTGIIMWKTG